MRQSAQPCGIIDGGKWRLAPWIISHFPEHKNYVEPCGGAASVLLQKPRSPLETYNDLDGNVVNFFRVLRDQPDELIRKIRLIPWARAEYELSKIECDDALESARRFFICSWMAISASQRSSSGWRVITYSEQCYSNINLNFGVISLQHLITVVERLDGVQIENIDALSCIGKYDRFDTLIYFDPPYILDERTSKNEYQFEWADNDHIEAATLLRDCQGYVVVSGYACPLYSELYEAHGWKRVDKEAQTNSGGKRIESLWLSPRTVEALAKPEQQTLF